MRDIIEITSEGVIFPKEIVNFPAGRYVIVPVKEWNENDDAIIKIKNLPLKKVVNYYSFPGKNPSKAHMAMVRVTNCIVRYLVRHEGKKEVYINDLKLFSRNSLEGIEGVGKVYINLVDKICQDFGIYLSGSIPNPPLPKYFEGVKFLG